MMVLQDIGLQLEHQQQKHPGGCVYGRRERSDDFSERDSVRVQHGGSEDLLAPEDIDIEREQGVHGVLEQLKQPVTADTQILAPCA